MLILSSFVLSSIRFLLSVSVGLCACLVDLVNSFFVSVVIMASV